MPEFLLHGKPAVIAVNDLVVAGWTGRDSATVEHHIADASRASRMQRLMT